jgi:hypothetical protein
MTSSCGSGFFYFPQCQTLPPLPPYMHSSQAALDKHLSLLSVVVGPGASTLLAPPLCAFFFFKVSNPPQGPIPDL